MSYDLYFWRRKPDCSLSDARIFALLSENLEVPELADLGAERLAARLDDAFPGWRSDEQLEDSPFSCSIDERVLVVETYGSTPATVFNWFERFASEEGLTAFDPQAEKVPASDLACAKRKAALVRETENAGRLSEEFGELRRRAERNDPAAQCELGNRYSFGEGVKRNLDEAFRWYLLAARNGSVDGMFNVAACYHRGHGVRRDVNAAIEWYTRAAEHDGMLAPFALGEIYVTGDGVERDNERARAFFETARANGHPDASAAIRMLDEPVITEAMKKKAWKFWAQ